LNKGEKMKRGKSQIMECAYVISVILLFILSISVKSAWSSTIYRYMDMPSDSVTSFPDFPNTFQSSLTSNGISTFSPAGNNYVANFYIPPSMIDDVAPFGNAIYLEANTFTFSRPVFAVGFTFITTESADNIPDISYEVRAYDQRNNLIENAFASSFTMHTGGPRHFYIGGSSIGDFAATDLPPKNWSRF
jgi:hypothetical protein